MRACLLIVSLAACGRIGIDERTLADDAGGDAPANDASANDASAIDAAMLVCPADMTKLSPTSTVCMDLDDRGYLPWLDGKALCEALGRRYCTDAEWLEGCLEATGLIGITGDYEWVAEEADGIAQKRGVTACTDSSAHPIEDPYEVRCCGPMI